MLARLCGAAYLYIDSHPGATGHSRAKPLKIIGLIPAAGHATRLGSAVAGSKELIPIATTGAPARPVCEYLLLQMQRAGIERVLMVIRDDKQDIPARLKHGAGLGVQIEYVVTSTTPSVPHTLTRALAQMRGNVVVLGFPDILVHEHDCVARLVDAFRARPVDALLGLFPLVNGDMDAVEMVQRRVIRVVPKPGSTTVAHTWAFAVWGERFTDYLHARLASGHLTTPAREPHMGDILDAAIQNGLTVDGVSISIHPFLDIGTPEGLAAARRVT